MKYELVIRLTIECATSDAGYVRDAVDSALDVGVLQDSIKERVADALEVIDAPCSAPEILKAESCLYRVNP